MGAEDDGARRSVLKAGTVARAMLERLDKGTLHFLASRLSASDREALAAHLASLTPGGEGAGRAWDGAVSVYMKRLEDG